VICDAHELRPSNAESIAREAFLTSIGRRCCVSYVEHAVVGERVVCCSTLKRHRDIPPRFRTLR
jgi:hypothetical protein